MELIFHEKQEGSLCAQHCLNSLLQGEYFTAVDLAKLADDLDKAEQQQMTSDSNEPSAQRHPVEDAAASSFNMDDSGFFSSQVITKALDVWGLEMIHYMHPTASDARQCPANENSFICNMQRHWFTIRKLGHQWFNLNSLMDCPDLVSDTYLHLFLGQLQLEGHTVFVVRGQLPECQANDYLDCHPITIAALASGAHPVGLTAGPAESDEEKMERQMLEAALEMSLQPLQPDD